jgi:DNA-binding transcriptional LysR family regulator
MNNFDYLAIDGKALQTFLAVLETGSVSTAARRLRITQSAVSHTLDKLRRLIGDPLFVRAGRGIVPTVHAEALAAKARLVLDDLKGLTVAGAFEPASAQLQVTIAANDFQRDLLLPGYLKKIRTQAPGVHFRIIASDIPSAEPLRANTCQLLITPHPPEGADIFQKRLLQDHYECFYDAGQRAAPASLQDYLAAQHLTVAFGPSGQTDIDQHIESHHFAREVVLSVPNFSGVPVLLRDTDLVATVPSLLRYGIMRDFAHAALPFASPTLTMYMVWHSRHHLDTAHQWLREQLDIECQALLQARHSGN